MTLDDRSRTAMTFDPDHLATLNEAANSAPWTTHQVSGQFTVDVIVGEDDLFEALADDAALIVYLRNHVDAILDQAAELATLRAEREGLLDEIDHLKVIDLRGPQDALVALIEVIDRCPHEDWWKDNDDAWGALDAARLAASTPVAQIVQWRTAAAELATLRARVEEAKHAVEFHAGKYGCGRCRVTLARLAASTPDTGSET